MNYQFVQSINEEAWRNFVEEQPSGNIFHAPEMAQVFGQARGHQPQVFAVVGGERVLALMTPVLVSLRDGFLRQMMTRAIAYGGVVYDPSPEGREALGILLKEGAQRTRSESLFIELRNLADVEPVRETLAGCGYVYEDHLNYLIDLSGSPEQVMQNIGSRTRKNIRHALRKGNVVIELVEQASQLETWYDLVKRTYAAARVPLADRSLFVSAFSVLHPKGMARFYLARIDSTYVAATAELPYKDVIYGWYSGVDRAFGAEYPGELLMWEILRWGAENGYKVYDFGGAGKPSEHSGVRDFKAKFGGQMVCFGRNVHVHSKVLLQVSSLGYKLYRQLIRTK